MKNPIFLIFLILIVGGLAINLPEGSRNIMLLLVILIGGLFALAVLIKDPRKKKLFSEFILWR